MEEIKGTLEHITFQNTESGFTVAKLKLESNQAMVKIVGMIKGVYVGEILICQGTWEEDKRFGKQFALTSFKLGVATSLNGIKRYLESGLISGIGPALAQRIVSKFGKRSLNIIDGDPQQLRKVQGVGEQKLQEIVSSWKAKKGIRGLMLFLQDHAISPTYAQKIHELYKGNSVQKIKQNPYRLAEEVVGIGFKKADTIGRLMGIEPEAKMRIDSGIEYALSQLGQQGHTCFPVEKFLDRVARLLGVAQQLVHNRLVELAIRKRIIIETQQIGNKVDKLVWAKQYYLWEKSIVDEVKRLKEAPILLDQAGDESNSTNYEMVNSVSRGLKIDLAEQQLQAAQNSLDHKIHIITGGPGTGKSTVTNVILKTYQQRKAKILLAAPTGRAAKRLSEITQHEAHTLHSLLHFDFLAIYFRKNRHDPLECDLLIVDEASMIDTFLMQGLLNALPNQAQLILVGDIDQLPSVGAGNVLRDFINSKQIRVTRLTQIFRQATHSKIVTNAHKINQGIYPDMKIEKEADFFFLPEKDSQKLKAKLLSLLGGRLKKTYGLDSMREIQVLSPMNKGELGTQVLNEAIQSVLNPPASFKKEQKRGLITFREGDKVIQMRNNYNKGVFNGDIAYIKEIDPKAKVLRVAFEQAVVEYTTKELNELELAYAITVHKYQGSECKCIILLIHPIHHRMLYRNLLYTGVTRGKKLVLLLGTDKAIRKAIRNDRILDRYTGLASFLKGK